MKDFKNKIINQNCLTGLKQIPDNSIDCCITSPPYFGLRDYGTASWEGGDPNCDHKGEAMRTSAFVNENTDSGGTDVKNKEKYTPLKSICKKCGAKRIDEQIGLEETPELFVQALVNVFSEIKRVLKPEGTLWLNLGDSYAGSWGNFGGGHRGSGTQRKIINGSSAENEAYKGLENYRPATSFKMDGIKPKDLIGIPWMVAFALRADGWYLRQDIIWHKSNPMPESVTDRCTKSHEYIFLLSKSAKYYYDNDAIKEDCTQSDDGIRDRKKNKINNGTGLRPHGNLMRNDYEKRNKRSVWTIHPGQFSEAHFATFPEDLISDCIKAGCPEDGIVLDPFMGSGTTAVVAKKMGRNYLGFELNPEYIKIAEKRIFNEIGLFL